MQFSIRFLLAVTLASGVACGVLFAFPHWLGALTLGLATLLLPAMLVAGIVYCRGVGRAFAIGWMAAEAGLFVLISPYLFMSGIAGEIDLSGVESESWLYIKVSLAVVWGYGIVSGFAAAAVRWLALPKRETAPVRMATSMETSGRAHGPHAELRPADTAQRRG